MHIKFLQSEIKEIEAEIRAIMETKAEKITEVLLSEKGIGEQTAAVLVASLPELGKLENRQITKLVGLAPMARESGKMKANRHIRGGRTRVRKAPFMASLQCRTKHLDISIFDYNGKRVTSD